MEKHVKNCLRTEWKDVEDYKVPCSCNEKPIDKIIRVFPRKTTHTPTDDLVFIGSPPFTPMIPEADEIHISVTFTWDIPEAERLYKEWSNVLPTKIGGPAFRDPGGEFTPGLYKKKGVTITTRGCIRKCEFCFVPKREGKLRLLKIKPGHIVNDNNLMAAPMDHFKKVFDMLKNQKQIIFGGGIDVRLMTQEKADFFKTVSVDTIFMAYDQDSQYEYLKRACEMLNPLTRDRKSCYMLVGFDDDTPEKAEIRLRKAYEAGCYPHMMFYTDVNGLSRSKKNAKYRELHKIWVNRMTVHTHMQKVTREDKSKKNQTEMFDKD